MKLSTFSATVSVAFADIVADDVCVSNGQEVSCDLQPTQPSVRSGRTEADRVPYQTLYPDLKWMAENLWLRNGLTGEDAFDDRKYWAYGCHCNLLGMRPITDMGMGRPKDAFDTKCKAYKECLQCVKKNHGDECIGDLVGYAWKWANKQGTFVGLNAAGSCPRELFECDKRFVYDMFAEKDVFDNQFHVFFGDFDNRDPEQCYSNGGVPVEHKCCGGHDQSFLWMNKNKNTCCATQDGKSGYVKASGFSCPHGEF
ncbi:unnamed protein product [Oikopleura dioica]|uniref:Uncharacterized protein n=1 Tax=Oikopleura dioica TaxID=34765 RepID=E4Y026_OIKDI|nr:unnamed protein product [Oikopleura dioica]